MMDTLCLMRLPTCVRSGMTSMDTATEFYYLLPVCEQRCLNSSWPKVRLRTEDEPKLAPRPGNPWR